MAKTNLERHKARQAKRDWSLNALPKPESRRYFELKMRDTSTDSIRKQIFTDSGDWDEIGRFRRLADWMQENCLPSDLLISFREIRMEIVEL